MVQLEVTLADGSLHTVISDRSWRSHAGPITAAHLHDGESYDARLEMPGWDTPGFRRWRLGARAAVRQEEGTRPGGRSRAPTRVSEELRPVKVSEPGTGVTSSISGRTSSAGRGCARPRRPARPSPCASARRRAPTDLTWPRVDRTDTSRAARGWRPGSRALPCAASATSRSADCRARPVRGHHRAGGAFGDARHRAPARPRTRTSTGCSPTSTGLSGAPFSACRRAGPRGAGLDAGGAGCSP